MTTITVQPQLGSTGVAAQAQQALYGQALSDQTDIDQTQLAYERQLNQEKVKTAAMQSQLQFGSLSTLASAGLANSIWGTTALVPNAGGVIGTVVPTTSYTAPKWASTAGQQVLTGLGQFGTWSGSQFTNLWSRFFG